VLSVRGTRTATHRGRVRRAGFELRRRRGALSAADRRLGLLSELAGCFADARDPARVQHEVEELLRERVIGIACGYDDANDASRLAKDPVFKLVVGRHPAQVARPRLRRAGPWPVQSRHATTLTQRAMR